MTIFTTRRFASAAAVACIFGAGFLSASLLHTDFAAHAQTAAGPGITAQVINVIALKDSDLNPVPNVADNFNKVYVTADGMTMQVQTGNVAKHMHPQTNEFQYVVEGTGKTWLGDKQIDFKPGDLLIIPKGTAHGGTTTTSGKYKAIAIKTPPQPAGDTTPLP